MDDAGDRGGESGFFEVCPCHIIKPPTAMQKYNPNQHPRRNTFSLLTEVEKVFHRCLLSCFNLILHKY